MKSIRDTVTEEFDMFQETLMYDKLFFDMGIEQDQIECSLKKYS